MEVDPSSDESDGEHHAHQDDSSDNEPGFVDGKLNGYKYPAYVQSPVSTTGSSHYLDMFTMQDLLPEAKKPRLKLGDSSESSTQKSQRSSGMHTKPAVKRTNKTSVDFLTAIAVDKTTQFIMDPESDLVNDDVCYSNNNISPVLSPPEKPN